ncbi:hypothetical protein [Aquibacillus albus]|uniref:Fur-regulated basic protein FbpA n=1 Tax=Aquibacillus albus TaxID=1168171 RepID=A0ABS2MYD3_9BACI|nr:hypothetical protein [Aquibacillus albus]MBM7570892.1 hypothetical protein [Aquibacillus albus]
MGGNKKTQDMTVELAKQLLKGENYYLTEEGKRRLDELLKKNR